MSGRPSWLTGTVARAEGERIVHVLEDPGDAPRVAEVIGALARVASFEQQVIAVCDTANPFGELGVEMPVTAVPARARMGVISAALGSDVSTVMLVYGDGDVTLGAAILAARVGSSVVRVGRAPGDAPMSRAVARLADLFLVPDEHEADALTARKVEPERIHVVGDPLLDAVRHHAPRAADRDGCRGHGLTRGGYALVVGPTEHRPAGMPTGLDVLRISGPGADGPGFLDRLSLIGSAALVVSDREQVRVEATALGVPNRSLGAGIESDDLSLALRTEDAGTRIAAVLMATYVRIVFVA